MKISEKRFKRAAGRAGKKAGKMLAGAVSSYASKHLNKLKKHPIGGFLSQFF